MKKICLFFILTALSISAFCGGKKDIISGATVDKMPELVQKKKIAYFFSPDNSNALQLAIQQSNFPVADWLAENEICDINHFNVYGKTPLYDAVESFDTEILSTLIEHGAVFPTEKYIKDPVIRTVQIGNLDAAKYFSSIGVKYNALYPKNQNLIHVAAQNSQTEIVAFLVESGCKIDAADSDGLTPLLISVENDDSQMIQSLLENGAAIEKLNANGQTPLFYAVEKFTQGSLQALVDFNANKEALDKKNRTPFLFAYELDNEQAAEYLISKGASFPKTQLLTALKDGKSFYLPLLLKAGADISVVDSAGQNVFHIAAKNSDFNSIELFSEKENASSVINQKDYSGNTPLHLACGAGTGFVNGVKELITGGASVSELNKAGDTALHIAVLNNSDDGSKQIALVLYNADNSLLNIQGSASKTPLIIALEHSKSQTASLLLEKKADVLAADSSGSTALHYACANGLDSLAKTIVGRKAPINAVNNRKETPMGLAAKFEHDDLAEYFLNLSGIDINISDASGKAPRDYLFSLYVKRHDEASKRWQKYFDARNAAQDSLRDTKNQKANTESELRDLQRQARELESQIKNADEGTNTSGLQTRLYGVNFNITAHNTSIAILNIAISKAEKEISEYKEKMDEEMRLQKSYTSKMERLTNIPR